MDSFVTDKNQDLKTVFHGSQPEAFSLLYLALTRDLFSDSHIFLNRSYDLLASLHWKSKFLNLI